MPLDAEIEEGYCPLKVPDEHWEHSFFRSGISQTGWEDSGGVPTPFLTIVSVVSYTRR